MVMPRCPVETGASSRDRRRQQRRTRKFGSMMMWRYGSQPESFYAPGNYSSPGRLVEDAFAQRVLESTRRRLDELPSDQWEEIYQRYHGDIVQAVKDGNLEYLKAVMDNPGRSDLFFGFEALSRSLRQGGMRMEDQHCPSLAFDGFLRLAEAMGVARAENPERFVPSPARRSIEPTLLEIERHLGCDLQFPTPFPNEYGLVTKMGIATERVPQAIYQAWRMSQFGGSVVEIGGGQGRVAYFANHFGVTDYAIVDIPITAIAQAAFLHKAGLEVTLSGESPKPGAIRLISPEDYFARAEPFDVTLNVDSITEFGPEIGLAYADLISKTSKAFYSINHEANVTTVLDLFRSNPRIIHQTRQLSWIRRGYVEEVFHFGS